MRSPPPSRSLYAHRQRGEESFRQSEDPGKREAFAASPFGLYGSQRLAAHLAGPRGCRLRVPVDKTERNEARDPGQGASEDHPARVVAAGMDKIIDWHSFRHSLATNLRSMGVDVKVAQKLLRHANSRITKDF